MSLDSPSDGVAKNRMSTASTDPFLHLEAPLDAAGINFLQLVDFAIGAPLSYGIELRCEHLALQNPVVRTAIEAIKGAAGALF